MRKHNWKKTSAGRLQKASLSTVARWISDVWKRDKVDVVAKAFRKCSITNLFNASEDKLLWDADSSVASYVMDSSGSGRD